MPNIFIYDLKSFKSIEVLKRLAGKSYLKGPSQEIFVVDLFK